MKTASVRAVDDEMAAPRRFHPDWQSGGRLGAARRRPPV